MLAVILVWKFSDDFLDILLRMIEIVFGAFVIGWLIYFLVVLIALRLRK